MQVSQTNLPFVPNGNIVFTQLYKEILQSLEQNFNREQNQPRIYVAALILEVLQKQTASETTAFVLSQYPWPENSVNAKSSRPHSHVPCTLLWSQKLPPGEKMAQDQFDIWKLEEIPELQWLMHSEKWNNVCVKTWPFNILICWHFFLPFISRK